MKHGAVAVFLGGCLAAASAGCARNDVNPRELRANPNNGWVVNSRSNPGTTGTAPTPLPTATPIVLDGSSGGSGMGGAPAAGGPHR